MNGTQQVLITGGTGFIGRHLIPALQKKHYQITVLSRTPEEFVDDPSFKNVTFIWALEQAKSYEIIINLAGENLANRRWNKKFKRKIYRSRIDNTIKLIDWIDHKAEKPHTLINGSAIGYYGSRLDESLNESSGIGSLKEFQVKLCHNWEASAQRANSLGVRTCFLRTGVVLGETGALPKMLLPFKFALGAELGNGQQWFSWIHIDDAVNSILHIIDDQSLSGAINLTSPNPVTNSQLTQALASAVNRPAFLRLPSFLLKIIVGEMANVLLTGQKVIPQQLLDSDFEFQYPTIAQALKNIVH